MSISNVYGDHCSQMNKCWHVFLDFVWSALCFVIIIIHFHSKLIGERIIPLDTPPSPDNGFNLFQKSMSYTLERLSICYHANHYSVFIHIKSCTPQIFRSVACWFTNTCSLSIMQCLSNTWYNMAYYQNNTSYARVNNGKHGSV